MLYQLKSKQALTHRLILWWLLISCRKWKRHKTSNIMGLLGYITTSSYGKQTNFRRIGEANAVRSPFGHFLLFHIWDETRIRKMWNTTLDTCTEGVVRQSISREYVFPNIFPEFPFTCSFFSSFQKQKAISLKAPKHASFGSQRKSKSHAHGKHGISKSLMLFYFSSPTTQNLEQ